MTRDISQSDSSDTVDKDHLLAVFNPSADAPISQSIEDVVQAIFTPALLTKLNGIADGAEVNLAGNAFRDAIIALGVFAQLGGATFTGAVRGIAPANAADFTRRDYVQLLSPGVWADITNGTTLGVGKIVEHGDAYFACITQHNKGTTGPDGDPTNWVLISNWRGTWTNAWYPVGSFVIHAGVPYIAGQAIVRGDPQPNASNNVKWLALGARVGSVVVASSNTAIPASAEGNTYLHTGSSNITYTLPAASGGGAVDDGWTFIVSNQGAGDLTIDGNGSDTIDGRATLVISSVGRSVQLQKVANGAWITIADTKDETGSGSVDLRSDYSTAATPAAQDRFFFTDENQSGDPVRYVTFNNLLAALVTDDSILDLAQASRAAADRGKVLGTSATNENNLVLLDAPSPTIADNSITPAKAQADTAARQKAWRERFGSARNTVGNAFPVAADTNVGDVHIFTQDVASGLTWRDISDTSTVITAADAGDVAVFFSRTGWVRVGNILGARGDEVARNAAAAAQTTADANKAVVDRLSVFENYDLNPAGISGNDFPEFIALTLSTKLTTKTITRLRVNIRGQVVANVQIPSDLTPFNNAITYISGGIVNLTLNSSARNNLKTNVGTAPQFVEVSVDYTFSDTTTANDRLHFGVNNNGFDLARNPDFSSGARSIAAATAGPVTIISNIASFDATQNRFEDSSGNEVVVPNGAIVTLTQAVYNAAVADTGFTPNANAIFLTR